MSNSNTSGAYCTHSPSPVHRSWSIQTCIWSVIRRRPQASVITAVLRRLRHQDSSRNVRACVCRVSFREHSTEPGGGRMAPEPREPQSGQRSGESDPDARRRADVPRAGSRTAPLEDRRIAATHARTRRPPRRDAGPHRRTQRPQRAAVADPSRGPRSDGRAQGGDRPAGPAAERLRRVPRVLRRRHGRHLHLRPQAARRRVARRSRSTSCATARRSCSTRR